MKISSQRRLLGTLLFGILAAFAASGWAYADPPSRVARLAATRGAVSFSPGGENDWVRASVNRPLITGDRLWADAASRAELQLGGTAIRIGETTSVKLLSIDDRFAQLQLSQGSLNLRIWRLERGQTFEVDTPNLAYSIRRPGSYRIQVDADGTSTTVAVRSGEAEVYGEGRAFLIGQDQSFRFFGTGLRDYDNLAIARPDDFDRWSAERDRRWERSVSARYVAPDLIGYEDLDEYGTWRAIAGYGNVWTPTRVAADWAPYRDGHWAWVAPWGWTWVDDTPWGFAPSHYGRWAHIDGAWGWVPGPITARPVYAPALVAFVGGSNFRLAVSSGNVGAVAWFALGPRDVYRPSYAVSPEYFSSINTSNTVINTTNITNVYNNTNVTKVVYVNQQVQGAVVAVPTAAFVQSRPVAKESVRVSQERAASTPVVALAPIAPVKASVIGVATPSAKPPEAVLVRPVLAKTAPPPEPASFAAKQSALAANPGKPLDPAAMAAAKPATPLAAPAIKVVTAPAQTGSLPRPQSSAAQETPRPNVALAPASPGETATLRPATVAPPPAVQAARAALAAASVTAPRNLPRPLAEAEPTPVRPAAAQRPEPPKPVPPAVATAVGPPAGAVSAPSPGFARPPEGVRGNLGAARRFLMRPTEEPRAPRAPVIETFSRNVPRAPPQEEHAPRAPAAAPRPPEASRPVAFVAPMAPPGRAAQTPQVRPTQALEVRPPAPASVQRPRVAGSAVPAQAARPAAPVSEPHDPRPRPEAGRAPERRDIPGDPKKRTEEERSHQS